MAVDSCDCWISRTGLDVPRCPCVARTCTTGDSWQIPSPGDIRPRPSWANRRHPTTSRPHRSARCPRQPPADRGVPRPRPTVRTGRATFPLRLKRRTSNVPGNVARRRSYFAPDAKCSRAPAIWRSMGAIVGAAGRSWMYFDVRAWPGRAPLSTVRRFRQPATSARVPAPPTGDIRPRPGHTETPAVLANHPLIATPLDHDRRCARAGLHSRCASKVER